MRLSATLLSAALLAGGLAVPAFADFERVGSVDFSVRDRHDSTYASFRGDGVALTAHDADMSCESVRAMFGDGGIREIFSGMIRRGETVNIDIPGRDRRVERLDFDCRPLDRYRGSVDVAADLGPSYGTPRFIPRG